MYYYYYFINIIINNNIVYVFFVGPLSFVLIYVVDWELCW